MPCSGTLYCGKALSRASCARQSKSVAPVFDQAPQVIDVGAVGPGRAGGLVGKSGPAEALTQLGQAVFGDIKSEGSGLCGHGRTLARDAGLPSRRRSTFPAPPRRAASCPPATPGTRRRRSRRSSSGRARRHGAAPRPCRRRRPRCAARPACGRLRHRPREAPTVAASNGGVSNAPSGPFQTSVFSAARRAIRSRHGRRARRPGSSHRPAPRRSAPSGSATSGLSSAGDHGVDAAARPRSRPPWRAARMSPRGRRASRLPAATCRRRGPARRGTCWPSRRRSPARRPGRPDCRAAPAWSRPWRRRRSPRPAAAGLPSAASSASSSACISRPA